MRKFLAGLALGSILTTTSFAVASPQVIKLIVDGKPISFLEAPPQIINSRVMVPARPLAEALGAKVEWDSRKKEVIVSSKGYQSTKTSSIWQGQPLLTDNSLEINIKSFEEVSSYKMNYLPPSVAGDTITARDNNTLFIFTYTVENKSDKYQEFSGNTVNSLFRPVPVKDDGRSWYFRPNDIDYSKLSENRYLPAGSTLTVRSICEIPKDLTIGKIIVPGHKISLSKDLEVPVNLQK